MPYTYGHRMDVTQAYGLSSFLFSTLLNLMQQDIACSYAGCSSHLQFSIFEALVIILQIIYIFK
jgi:hypothetical protein